MERSCAALWTYLLGAGLALAVSTTTSETLPRPPRLIGCVFLNRANVTCNWDAGDTPATHYTLQIQKKPGPLEMFTCTTSHTSCTAGIQNSSVRFTYCVVITAHARGQNVSSASRCQPGRTEVMLPPVVLDSVKPVAGRPPCLNLSWRRTLSLFPVSRSEVKNGNLNSQIEFAAQGQIDTQVRNVTVKYFSFVVCSFRPDTLYTIRLRHRYRGPESPWSPWSNARQRRTLEDAPSAAPAFWRRIEQRDVNGWRRVSLLWKPLPHFLANGRVLFYNVTCQTEGAEILNDYGSCRDLCHANTSCSLLLPFGRCFCALTASNSVGTSPEARIWLLGSSDREPPSPSQITADPLDESTLDVGWASPDDRSVSGFILEWFAVREDASSVTYWERLNSSCSSLVITEGIKPMELYEVSVKVLYGERGAGKNVTLHIYTLQGAPSAGPVVKVEHISGGTVELSWSPVAVQLLHGFIRNYTLCYSASHQPARSVFIPDHAHGYSLKNLSPGNYDIFMRANTDAGAGAAGPIVNVHIDYEEISVAMYAVLPLIVTSLALLLMACLGQNHRVKQKLCQDVPDPSHSSLAHWTPKTALKGMKHSLVPEKSDIKYSEVVFLGESEQQSSDPDRRNSCDSHCSLQTYSTHRYSQVPVSMFRTHQNTRLSQMSIWSPTRAKTTSSVDLSSCSYINSKALTPQTLTNVPTPYVSPFYCHAASVSDVRMQPGEEENPPQQRSDSSPSSADEAQTFTLLVQQCRIPASISDFSRMFQSTALASHPPEVVSPYQPFSQFSFNSVPSL